MLSSYAPLILLAALYACTSPGHAAVHLLTDEEDLAVGSVIEWHIDATTPEHDNVRAFPYLFIEEAKKKLSSFASQRWQYNAASDAPEYVPLDERRTLMRHTFHQAGTFTLHFHSHDHQLLSTQTITIRAAQAWGPVKATANRRLLTNPAGAFVPISTNICWANGPNRLQQMKDYIDAFRQNGGNHIRLWMASWFGQIESDRPNSYRHDQAWVIDEVLQYCQAHRVYVTLVLDNAYDLVHGKAFPYGATTEQRVGGFLRTPLSKQYEQRIRYTVARYGAYDCILAWELFNELDEALIGQPKPMDMQDEQHVVGAWTKAASDFLTQQDPYDRLITVSLASQPWYHIFKVPNIHLAQYHCYLPPLSQIDGPAKDGVAVLWRKKRTITDLDIPLACTESGYQGSNEDNPANLLDPTGILLRNQAWGGFLIGGWTTGMNWWWDVYIHERNLWNVYQPISMVIDRIDWNDQELAPLPLPGVGSSLHLLGWRSPSQALIWPRSAEDTWFRQTIEMKPQPEWENGRDIRLTGMQPTTDFVIDGIDMNTGKTRYQSIVGATKSGTLYIHLPAGPTDTVLVIKPLPVPEDSLDSLD